jgi:hypothetical protein
VVAEKIILGQVIVKRSEGIQTSSELWVSLLSEVPLDLWMARKMQIIETRLASIH